jgi:hypothetical protein
MTCPQRGKKRESSGGCGQKQGSSTVFDETCRHFGREIFFGISPAGVRATDRCYEPAGTESVVAIPTPGAAIPARQGALLTIS